MWTVGKPDIRLFNSTILHKDQLKKSTNYADEKEKVGRQVVLTKKNRIVWANWFIRQLILLVFPLYLAHQKTLVNKKEFCWL